MSSALGKALLNLQMQEVHLVRAVQGPPRKDRSKLTCSLRANSLSCLGEV